MSRVRSSLGVVAAAMVGLSTLTSPASAGVLQSPDQRPAADLSDGRGDVDPAVTAYL